MKAYARLAICILIWVSATPLFAQETQHSTLHLPAPAVINFKQAAENELAHPLPKRRPRVIEQGEDREGEMYHPHRNISNDARKFDVKIPSATNRTMSPPPNANFNGTLDNGSLIPPDVSGAAGNNYLIETSNQELAIYHKTGTLNSKLNYVNFFLPAGGHSYFDPVIAYDANHQCFIICVDGLNAQNHSTLFFGISQTPDPTGDWFIYSFDATGNPDDFLDYPTMGLNKNWVVVSGNDFLGNGGYSNKVYVLNRAELYQGLGGTVNTYTVNDDWNITPAVTADPEEATLYLVSDWDGSNGGYGYMKIYKVTGTASNPSFSSGTLIGVNMPWNDYYISAPQKDNDNPLEAGNSRVSTPFFINNSLWFTHSVSLSTGGSEYSGVDWWQVDPETNSVLQFGRVEDPTGNIFYFYPSLSVNKENDALLGYSVSSATMYPGAQYSYREGTDPLNTMQDGYMHKAGLAPYFKDFGSYRNRWGDYSGTCTDPTDNSFWTFQEFANTPANTWATVIANVGGIACTGFPEVGTVDVLFPSICPGEKTFLNLNGYTFGVSKIQLQWQQSANGINGWTNAQGQGSTSARYETEPLNQATFFRCIITCTGSGLSDTSDVYSVAVNGFVSVMNDTICAPGVVQLVPDGAGFASWYETATSSVPFFSGDTLTANITGDTTFYVSTSTIHQETSGAPENTIGSGSYYSGYNEGLVFKALSNFVLDSVFVYPKNAGLLKIKLFDFNTGALLDSSSLTVNASDVMNKTVVPLNMKITGGAFYKLNAGGSNVSGLYRNTEGAAYPYEIPGMLSIIHTINNNAGYYYFFYDWHVTAGCKAELFPVYVHIDSPLVLIVTDADTICEGSGITLTGVGAESYVWEPGNVSGTAVTFYPLVTTQYTVTGTNMYGCVDLASINIAVKECGVGIEEVNALSSLQVYPVLVTGELTVFFNYGSTAPEEILIMNVVGKEMMRTPAQSNFHNTLNVSSLTPGLYLISVGKEVRKFVKL